MKNIKNPKNIFRAHPKFLEIRRSENSKSYTHLTEEEREQIHYLYYKEQKSKEKIAEELGREPSTIYSMSSIKSHKPG